MPEKMMDEFDRWLLRIAKAVGLLLICWIAISWWNAPKPLPTPLFDEAERRYYAERHKFHGISSSSTDLATGERYFWRDGQKCKL